MEQKQSSVEWLIEQLEFDVSVSNNDIKTVIEQAKAMHKEEIIEAHKKGKELLEHTTPIELPSDEEIDTYVQSTGYYGHCTTEYREGIEEGAKWMRDKIQGGNQ